MDAPAEAPSIAFGDFEIDVVERRLLHRRKAVDLRRKAWLVLRHLAERPGRLISKDELLDQFWGGAVTPQVLTNVIRELRVALRDEARSPRWIATVHSEGYRFIGAVADGGRAVSVPPAEAFVARAAEMAQLRAAFERARCGERQMLFVSGEPGIGKTALCQRFLESLGAERGVRVAVGHCLEQHGPGEPYLPVLEAIERLAARSARAARSLLRRRAPTWFLQMPWLAEGGEMASVERSLRGTTAARMLREGAVLLESVGGRGCCVLLIEDLHWADPATLDLIAALAERQGRAPLFLLATLRRADPGAGAELANELRRTLVRRRRATEIALPALGVAAVETYLASRLNDAALADRLALGVERKSGGNPLYMRSIADRLVEQRAAAADDDDLIVESPDDLRDLVRESIRRLSPDLRDALETAAVVGADFFDREVAVALACAVEDGEELCDRLTASTHLIEVVDDAPADDRRGRRFRFSHAIYRGAVYENIAPGRRERIHHRVAAGIEELYADRRHAVAGRLALHFGLANEPARQVESLQQAAQTALRRLAFREAQAYLRAALALLDDRALDLPPQWKVELLTLSGTVRVLADGYSRPEVRTAFEQAERLGRRYGVARARGAAMMGVTTYYLTTAGLPRARRWTDRLLELSVTEPEFTATARCLAGYVRALQGELSVARRFIEECLQTDRVVGVPFLFDVHRMARSLLANTLSVIGELEEARRCAAAALRASERFGAPPDLAHSAVMAAEGALLRGDLAAASEAAQRAVRVSDENEFPTYGALGRFYFVAADRRCAPIERVPAMRAQLERRRAIGDRWQESLLLALLAEAQLDAGLPADAEATAREGLAFARHSGERHHESGLHRILAEALGTKGEAAAESRAHLRRAVAIAEKQGSETLRARAASLLAARAARSRAAVAATP